MNQNASEQENYNSKISPMLLGSSLAGTHNWVSSVDNEKACLFR
jgi:hypothetical protein